MCGFDNFEFYENCNGPLIEDDLDSLIASIPQKKKIKTEYAKANIISIKGKNAADILNALRNNDFVDNRNHIKYRGMSEGERLAPIISGFVSVAGFDIEYILIGQSSVFALLQNGKRFIITSHDVKPYQLSLDQKTGNGKCVFGVYKGRRIVSHIIWQINLRVLKCLKDTNQL